MDPSSEKETAVTEAGGEGFGPGLRLLLGLIVFVAFLDNFAQFPVLAPLAESLGAGPLMAGVILGMYSLSNLVGNLAVGPVLDRRGPVAPLVASLAVTALVLAGYSVATTPTWLLGLRALHGAAAAAIVPAVFVLATARGEGRGGSLGRMGALGATIGLAAMAGPPASGILARYAGFGAVYVSLAALFAAAALVAGLLLGRWARASGSDPEREAGIRGSVPGEPQAASGERPVSTGALMAAAARTGLLHTWAGAGALVFGVGSLALVLPLEMGSGGTDGAMEAGKLLGIFSVAATVVMVLLARVRRSLEAPALLSLSGAGLSLMATALAAIALVPPGSVRAPLLVLLGTGFGLTFPTLAAGVSLRSPPWGRGRGYAVFYAAFSAGAFLGPSAAGMAAAWAGLRAGYLPAVAVLGLVGAACLIRGLGTGGSDASTHPRARGPEHGSISGG